MASSRSRSSSCGATLEENAGVLLENDIVRHIALGRGAPFGNTSPAVDTRRLDQEVLPGQLPLVLDADSTQTAAVVAALAGRTFVLQGPPGTGKSQTITNIIAAAIAANKTVLFVSEKMAALEVVHRRLQEAGLGDFCLELHSNKARKKEVLASLSTTLGRAIATQTPPWSDRSDELGRQRGQLNAYPAALHASRPLGQTFYRASARLLNLAAANRARLNIQPSADTAEPQFRAFMAAAGRLADAAAEVEPVAANPWRGYLPPDWSARAEQRILDLVDGVYVALERAARAARPLAEGLEISAPDRIDHLGMLAALGDAISAGALPPQFADDVHWVALRARADRWIAAAAADSKRRADLATRWRDALFLADLDGLQARFVAWGSAFVILAWLFLFPSKRRLRAVARGPLPGNSAITADLGTAKSTLAARPGMEEDEAALQRDLGSCWPENTAAFADLFCRGDALRSAMSQASLRRRRDSHAGHARGERARGDGQAGRCKAQRHGARLCLERILVPRGAASTADRACVRHADPRHVDNQRAPPGGQLARGPARVPEMVFLPDRPRRRAPRRPCHHRGYARRGPACVSGDRAHCRARVPRVLGRDRP